ncbi:MAG: 5'-nucleotidase C-terminal domain-containing protein [Phocaeicola sp.]
MIKIIKSKFIALWWVSTLLISGCSSSSYSVVGVEGRGIAVTSEFDAHPNVKAQQLLQSYKESVDSIMSPIIGKSVSTLVAKRPEGELSNLLADILRNSTTPYIGKPADVAIMNVGGVRKSLPAGPISYGDIFQVTPFENSLTIVDMSGATLLTLFRQIAAKGGEGISGVQLVITENKELVTATVGGKEVVEDQLYRVATVDYVADGNDGMPAFRDATNRIEPNGETMRKLFLDYVHQMTQAGKSVDAKIEGRVTIKE